MSYPYPSILFITAKLAALHFYQLAIPAPKPPKGSFDEGAARRGKDLFNGKAQCATCHVPPLFTEPGWNMHTAEELGIDDFQAKRSPDERYRTAPLKGLWTHTKGGFFQTVALRPWKTSWSITRTSLTLDSPTKTGAIWLNT